jgi:hypothetical protein
MPAHSPNGASGPHRCTGNEPEPALATSPPRRRRQEIAAGPPPHVDRQTDRPAGRPQARGGASAQAATLTRSLRWRHRSAEAPGVSNQTQDCAKPVPRPRTTPIGADLRATVCHTTSPAHSTLLEP